VQDLVLGIVNKTVSKKKQNPLVRDCSRVTEYIHDSFY
jgi:hypothetical protein